MPTNSKSLRAVIYARYSTNLQSEASIEDQTHLCREIVERNGWSLKAVYADKATSGASAMRTNYQRLIEDAHNNCFDVVVAEALDRLSRDQEDIAGLYKRLSYLGIRIVTIAEGKVNELHIGLKGTMNALFLKDLAAKTHRGLEGRIRAGRSAGGNCYGYDVVREIGANGEPVRGLRSINPYEAKIVRRIFEWFAGGVSPVEIAKRLNAEGVPGPREGTWSDTTIRGSHKRGTGILRNQLYIGQRIWNRLHYAINPDTGTRQSKLNPQDKLVEGEVSQLGIIDQELWDRVQTRLDEIRTRPGVIKLQESRFWEKRRAKHLLTRLVMCGSCGNPMTNIGQDYLACNHAKRRGTCTNTRSIRRGKLEDLILDTMKDRLMAPELVKEFISAFQKETKLQRKELERSHRDHARELDNIDRKIDRLVDALAEGLESAGVAAKLNELERRKAELEMQRSNTASAPVVLHPNLAELYQQQIEHLRDSLACLDTRTEALEIIRSLIERIVLHPVVNGYEIELVGEIANMVALANGISQESKNAASNQRDFNTYHSSVKVVAGARYQRCLHLDYAIL